MIRRLVDRALRWADRSPTVRPWVVGLLLWLDGVIGKPSGSRQVWRSKPSPFDSSDISGGEESANGVIGKPGRIGVSE